ncbi:ATP-binding protein [Patescibacteria group bacterium]|nr:ATP-binding protein [Patescibacteria group bacterium]MBU4512713.1 ATP-binding protein [Patescibacteria group bacterium]MCG2688428.1 ATP-binding protein [Candidatus Parcubacteria bacterium]MCG2693174.1 ATP-binding protein [Candidatus Parcubacteria bacterium]
MYVPQRQLKNLKNLLSPNKVVIIYGPRRCGKTTLINKFLEKVNQKHLLVNGEDIIIQEYLSSQSIEKLKGFVGKNKLLVIDEAQKIKEIGLNLKLIVDNIKDVKVIATGSSSFDLAKNIGEPLTGRKYTLRMFPLAQLEIKEIEKIFETKANLENRLIYGSYPEVVITANNEEREKYLKEIISSYLYKDILELEGLKHSNKIVRLLQLLAFQIGKEVSFNELGGQLGMSKNTVEKYLDLLEKTFVVYSLSGFSRNLRKEISKNSRYYFFDLGVRNALINNFNPLKLRDDLGMLWENYIIIERIKRQEYLKIFSNNYFWRTYDQKEIDFIEERKGKLYGYEIKWAFKKSRPPKDWLETYKNAKYEIISKDNYLKFIT